MPAIILVVLAAAAAAYVATRPTATPVQRAKPVHHPRTTPDVPVTVLNATQTSGAAHQLAVLLQGHKVKVSAVGNVTETLPPGTEILYASGERSQAKLLAKVLANRSPSIAPIDPVTSAAAAGAKLVVVIA